MKYIKIALGVIVAMIGLTPIGMLVLQDDDATFLPFLLGAVFAGACGTIGALIALRIDNKGGRHRRLSRKILNIVFIVFAVIYVFSALIGVAGSSGKQTYEHINWQGRDVYMSGAEGTWGPYTVAGLSGLGFWFCFGASMVLGFPWMKHEEDEAEKRSNELKTKK